jgi:Protein of unknown function (DUF2721)
MHSREPPLDVGFTATPSSAEEAPCTPFCKALVILPIVLLFRASVTHEANRGGRCTRNVLLAVQLSHLHRRSLARDAAVLLAAFGGAAKCALVLTLFVVALRNATVASVLFTTFGLAVICTIGAIGVFTAEMMMAGSGVRAEVAAGRRSSEDERVPGSCTGLEGVMFASCPIASTIRCQTATPPVSPATASSSPVCCFRPCHCTTQGLVTKLISDLPIRRLAGC